ncbi:MAG TPA: 4-(cytidine 5'-diphospho)-2-C-methyl-D-erythritol kinase [Pirellulales bacterium]
MHVRSTAAGLEVLAPAKLNLFLEVLGKRADGLHEIETLMYPIDVYDTLVFHTEPHDEVRLMCDSYAACERLPPDAAEQLPQGADNLVVRALELLRRQAGVARGMHVQLIKRIPLAAGLAGGSSDAAAALVAGNRLWRLGRSLQELAALAGELGSDVPFFLYGGAAVCRGRGDLIEPVRGLGRLHFVVAKPAAGLATAEVYRACRPASQPRRAGGLLDALRKGALNEAAAGLHNALEAAAMSLSPVVARLSQEFARLDFLGRRMSGSGTSYFGLCRHARHARRLAAYLRARGVGQVYAVQGTC